MHVWAETTIQAPAILLFTCLTISSANILTDVPKNNPLNIWWSPAPPPADGPPLSASASRDRALLPAQIGGIIGAYLFSVCIVGIALICLGRKLRHQIQISPKALDIEMVEPRFETAQPTPHPLSAALSSPGGSRNFSWPSPEKDIKNPYIFPPSLKSPRTPTTFGDPYVDTRIVEADREMLNRDLEDIYAHVMAQEEAKAQGIMPKEMPPPAQLQRTGSVPTSPPQRQLTPPKKSEKSRPANLNIDETRSTKSNQSRVSSLISSLKSPRKGIKGMRISSPIPTPASATFPLPQEDEEPLTPRYQTLPPPPPVPTDQVPFRHHRSTSNLTAAAIAIPLPTSPRSNFSQPLSPRSPYGNMSIRSHRSQYQNNPSQVSIQSSHSRDPNSAVSATSQTPLHPLAMQPPPKRQPSPNPPSNNSSVRQLPLRQFEPAVTSPSFAPSTKTTVLERNGPAGGGGPQTGGLRTPWSAGAVPYSPYQPFTPIMPITPRLVTKEDRKAMKKRGGRTPVLEMIKSEDELWDSAY
jgi:hypothetical protein